MKIKSTHPIFDLLENMQHAHSPLLSIGNQVLIKHEGLGMNAAHKFRSAAWIWERRLKVHGIPDWIGDRSSGTWAIGNAIIAGALGIRSTWVTVGEPHGSVRETIETNGGEFIVVENNANRRAVLQRLLDRGMSSPDQHNNPMLLRAFKETLGEETAGDLQRAGIQSEQLRYVAAAVGTGGSGAGLSLGLRANGFGHFQAIGCDSMLSIVGCGNPACSPFPLAVPGVGSADEVCRTYRVARPHFSGELLRVHPIAAAEEAAGFRRIVARGCGLSSGLVLAAAKRDLLPKLKPGERVLLLFADDSSRYAQQLKVFGNPSDR